MRVMEPARKKQQSIFDFFSESQSGSSTSSATVEEHELQPLGISLSQECQSDTDSVSTFMLETESSCIA